MASALYENPLLREITGDILRPGGLELTVRALEFCAFPPGSRLLDAGCGVGGTLRFLHHSGFAALGIERRADFAAEARAYGPVLRADLAALPLADAGFAGVFCECVLSLFTNKGAILRELFRVLHPGGRLILADLCAVEDSGSGGTRPTGCAAGAVTVAILEQLCDAAGFAVSHREDHSRALRELTARMVWQAGGTAAFIKRAGFAPDRACAGGFTYHLIIAEKRRVS